MSDIGNANTGVHYALSNLYNGLTGNTGIGGGRKLIDVWHNNAYKHLSNTKDAEYTVSTYVEELDTKLAATFELIRNGLILLIMTTKGAWTFPHPPAHAHDPPLTHPRRRRQAAG